MRGDGARARSEALAAKAIEPWAASPYLQLGFVAEAEHNYPEAVRWANEAIRHSRRDWSLWTDRGDLRDRERERCRRQARLRRGAAPQPAFDRPCKAERRMSSGSPQDEGTVSRTACAQLPSTRRPRIERARDRRRSCGRQPREVAVVDRLPARATTLSPSCGGCSRSADVLAVAAAAVLVGLWGSGSAGALLLVLSAPIWIVTAKLAGLYDRDHRTLRHLTVDELPWLMVWTLSSTALLTLLLAPFPSLDPSSDDRLLVWGAVLGLGFVFRASSARSLAQDHAAATGAHRRRGPARAGRGAEARALPGHPRRDPQPDPELRGAARATPRGRSRAWTGS